MIKFFRQIRYKLMNKNKTSKYFKYAIGEIALVMIGILLAIQANNWNIERTAKKELNQSLSKLLVELNQDKFFLNAFLDQNSNIISKLDSCLIILKNPQNYSIDTFDNFYHYTNYTISFDYSTESFDELSSQGKLKLISNDKLSDSLISYYSNTNYKSVEEALKDHTRDNLRAYTTSFDFFGSVDDLDTYKASDFGINRKTLDDYRTDVRIINGIRFKIVLHRFIEVNYKDILPRTEFLINTIEKELKEH
jgi:hypothetical protein